MSSPKMLTWPAVGTSRPASSPSKVDLPEPEAPTIAAVSPASMARLISSSIVRLPVASCTTLPRPCASTAMFFTSSSASRRTFLNSVCSLIPALALARHSKPAEAQAAPAPDHASARPVILVVGDSLSAEYGLPRGTGWVQLLTERLRSNRFNYTVVNASISGETTSGGRTRLPALLKQHRPAVVIIELGANDGLRGLPLNTMRDNLVAMAKASQSAGAAVMLVGVRVPPNYGRDYSERFFGTFPAVARELRTPLAPFLLDGFAEQLQFFQADRIHPNEAAQSRMLDNVWPHLKPLLRAGAAKAR